MVMEKIQAQQIFSAVTAKIADMEAEIELLTGKENKKLRNQKSRDISTLKHDVDYVDAERILEGKEPLQEHNKVQVVVAEEVAEVKGEEDKVDKKKEKALKKLAKKGDEGAGISPAEKNELEELKQKLIARKTELKAEGMSGGQMNKQPDIVEWVTRMTVLKEKAGEVTDKKKEKKEKKGKKGNTEEADKLKEELEAYKIKLKEEFGYTKGDINKDEDIVEMTKRLKTLTA